MNYPFTLLLLAAAFLFAPSSANAQRRGHRTATATKLKMPDAPTPLNVSERTIADLLYFPFATISTPIGTAEEAMQLLTKSFGTCERINGSPGMHYGERYDYTYRGTTIGTAWFDSMDNRMWYRFYFNTRTEADKFYSLLANDIKEAGIPLVNDKIYGGLSNRTHPVNIFKWVSITPAERVMTADDSNIDGSAVVGTYVIELAVYKSRPKG